MTDLKQIIRLAEAAITLEAEVSNPNNDLASALICHNKALAAFEKAANPATVKAMAERLMRYEKALHLISLASQNSTETKHSMGKVAREALENKP